MSGREGTTSAVTIAISAGVSAVVSAIVVTIGVVGMTLSDDGRNTGAQTVVALPAAAAAPAAVSAPAPAAAPVPVPPPAAAPVPAPDPAPTPVPAASAPEPAPAPVPVTAEPIAAPAALSEGQLIAKLKVLLNPAASAEAKGAELESGTAGLRTVNAVAGLLATAGPAYSWTIVGPVSVNGNTLTAQLQTSLIGMGDRLAPLTWTWVDGTWKLSNASSCYLASQAMVPCSI